MGDFHLETERLIIRNWCEEDRDLFYLINFDERVMEFFPIRRDCQASDKMMDELAHNIRRNGFGFIAVTLKETQETIGFCGLAEAGTDNNTAQELVEIGWRLAPQFWGNGYVTEASEKLLDFGFNTLDLEEIVSFAVHDNTRSLAVMKRLGMRHDPERDFDHHKVPDTHPKLKRHHFHSLTKTEYRDRIAKTD